jgi:hypothetical protein
MSPNILCFESEGDFDHASRDEDFVIQTSQERTSSICRMMIFGGKQAHMFLYLWIFDP